MKYCSKCGEKLDDKYIVNKGKYECYPKCDTKKLRKKNIKQFINTKLP